MRNTTRTQYTASDAAFTAKIDAWQPAAKGFVDVFGKERTDALNEIERERGFSADNRKIVFLTFENKFAPLGGLAAVMRFLPEFMSKYGEDVVLMTPCYPNIPKMKEALGSGQLEPVFVDEKFPLPIVPLSAATDNEPRESSAEKHSTEAEGGDNPRKPSATKYPSELTVSCYRDVGARAKSYYIHIDGRFTASSNPYSYADNDDLLDDSLAFCAAVPHALAKLGIIRDILFHAHDWETAPIAVTSKAAVLDGVLKSARAVLTLHNSFDSGIAAYRKNAFFGTDTHGAAVTGDTVLQCAIPMLSGPLTTVSAPFAAELRDDALQRTVFTNHLQGVFAANPPVGIDNGMFGRPYLQYTYTALSRGRQGDFSMLLKQKARFRERMLDVVNGMSRPEVIGGLKGLIDSKKPIFFMSGRLDIMQKGFDVIFQAMQMFDRGEAGLIFCPSSAEGAKHSKEIAFFRDIADKCGGDIVIWPFRITAEDYVSVVLGSSFLLMPSLYEPFGAATEGFMHGTPVIARATGGLAVQVRCEPPDEATGFLYREKGRGDKGEGYEETCREWREILGAGVGERINVPLYRSMVDEAYFALKRAANVFADGQAYGRMMLCGMESLRGFSWDAAVRKYRRVYDSASRRGFFDA